MSLLELNRVTKDIGIFGKKGSFKTTILSLIGYLENRYYGTDIYSNMNLNFPHEKIGSIGKLKEIPKTSKRKMYIGDDFENWFFSRMSGSKKSIALSEILLNWGKINCGLHYSAKREMAIDVGLRESTVEFWEIEVKTFIRCPNAHDHNKIIKYADFLYLKINRIDDNLNELKPLYVFYLKEILEKGLFDTFEIIENVSM